MAAARTGSSRFSRNRAVAWFAILALGLGLRLWGLDAHTLTHAEVYVPRLEMPEYVSAPPPRPTLAATALGTLHHDNHPPGYYAFMWAWTGAFGTGLSALRLPSALVGAATVGLLFFLLRRRDGDGVALFATALLALHGHHLFWSQQARMWVFLAAFAVLSILLLDSLHRRFRATSAVAYVAVVAAGLWFEYSFWPFFFAQIFWELCRSCETPRAPATLDLQLAALVSSLPVLWFLKAHLASERTEYLARTGLVDHLGGFLLLQWWLRGPAPPERLGPLASFGVLALLVVCAALLVAGVVYVRSATGSHVVPEARTPGLASAWRTVVRPLRAMRKLPWLRRLTDDPASVHVLLPLTILLVGSLFVPSVAARSLLFITPFALWLVARGLFAWLRSPTLRIIAIAALLGVGVISVRQYTKPWGSHYDYQGLAAAMQADWSREDLILIHDSWRSQPMHYYLPPSRYRTGDFGEHSGGLAKAGSERPERLWVVIFGNQDVAAFETLKSKLGGYRERKRVDASAGYAVLLQRRNGKPPVDD
ncbi:MAG: glycosyltransferase family 39 protein [Deltaproteobacteria bacterium]|nr:glycosyltransferase family 39 protein [Deltaproteobacteria bacterium]MBW2665394.1 glycosyltransferase family 39 protein [Deltaproteobacteria bacterium]